MQTYQVISLVDITRSRPDRSCTDQLKLGQQANFNTLIQTIGIRSNLEWQTDPEMHTGRLPYPFDGAAVHWTWTFSVERDYIFEKDGDPVALLFDDINGVPVVDGLNNTVMLKPSVFQTKGKDMNIWISRLT